MYDRQSGHYWKMGLCPEGGPSTRDAVNERVIPLPTELQASRPLSTMHRIGGDKDSLVQLRRRLLPGFGNVDGVQENLFTGIE